jgi:hypothetical protein
VDLFLETPSKSGKSYDRFYIIRNIDMPGGSSLLLDDSNLFNFSSTKGLYATCLDGNEIDVTIT